MTKKILPLLIIGALGASGPVLAAEPPAAFNACKACHKVEAGKNGVGPSLFGVYGRKAGTGEGFAYSAAMTGSGLTWDDASLTKYLSNPKEAVPGNKMAYAGMKNPADVTSVIDYLKTLK